MQPFEACIPPVCPGHLHGEGSHLVALRRARSVQRLEAHDLGLCRVHLWARCVVRLPRPCFSVRLRPLHSKRVSCSVGKTSARFFYCTRTLQRSRHLQGRVRGHLLPLGCSCLVGTRHLILTSTYGTPPHFDFVCGRANWLLLWFLHVRMCGQRGAVRDGRDFLFLFASVPHTRRPTSPPSAQPRPRARGRCEEQQRYGAGRCVCLSGAWVCA